MKKIFLKKERLPHGNLWLDIWVGCIKMSGIWDVPAYFFSVDMWMRTKQAEKTYVGFVRKIFEFIETNNDIFFLPKKKKSE